jgi:hypothetical protein
MLLIQLSLGHRRVPIGQHRLRHVEALRKFLFMGLIGLIIAGPVNMIWPSGTTSFIISAAGVLIFSGLIALRHPEDQGTVCRRLGHRHRREGRDLRRAQHLARLHQPFQFLMMFLDQRGWLLSVSWTAT